MPWLSYVIDIDIEIYNFIRFRTEVQLGQVCMKVYTIMVWYMLPYWKYIINYLCFLLFVCLACIATQYDAVHYFHTQQSSININSKKTKPRTYRGEGPRSINIIWIKGGGGTMEQVSTILPCIDRGSRVVLS